MGGDAHPEILVSMEELDEPVSTPHVWIVAWNNL